MGTCIPIMHHLASLCKSSDQNTYVTHALKPEKKSVYIIKQLSDNVIRSCVNLFFQMYEFFFLVYFLIWMSIRISYKKPLKMWNVIAWVLLACNSYTKVRRILGWTPNIRYQVPSMDETRISWYPVFRPTGGILIKTLWWVFIDIIRNRLLPPRKAKIFWTPRSFAL